MIEPIDQTALVRAANALDPLPASVARLATLVTRKTWSLSEAEEIIGLDQALAARLLRLANSAAAGSRRQIVTIEDALMRMGIGVVLSMATGSSVQRLTKTGLPQYGLSEGDLWRHSVAAALAAEAASGVCGTTVPPESFAAALLHDVGKLVFVQFLEPKLLGYVGKARDQCNLEIAEAETEILGFHHGELGGLIAQHWKLPKRIVNAIIHHHTPEQGHDVVCDVVCVANVVAKRVGAGYVALPQELKVPRDTLERLKLSPKGVEKMCVRVQNRLDGVLAQYQAA
jgi:putative nucleotidyltransferase with HDIG domain